MTFGSTGLPADNPFNAPSDLPFGLPPFDRIRPDHYRPAFAAGMAGQRAEVEAIATDPEPATFVNTVEALERSGALLTRVAQVFFNLTSSVLTDELAAIEAEVTPQLAAHSDAIHLDRRLFARLAALHAAQHDSPPGSGADSGADSGPDDEQQRLLDRYHTDFVRAGAALQPAQQDRLREINAELATLGTAFKNDLLADTVELAVHVSDRAELDGLPDGAISAAEQAASARGLDGYLLTLGLPSSQPELEQLTHRGLRERLHRASVARGGRGSAHDTRAAVARVVALRAERAVLLGYPDHAGYVIEDETAGSLAAVDAMLSGLIAPAVANAEREAAELESALHADGHDGPLQAWDWPYYARIVRDRTYQVDVASLQPYFELERVVTDGIFFAANALYGLSFTPRTDLAGYPDDVQVFEVTTEDGAALGLFLADWYARDSKRGGAWMSSFVDQSRLLDAAPVIVINLNVPRPAAGEPTLLTLDEVETAFHEFGHVLHGLLSDVRYPKLSGTNVPRDFVEFPSQVNEMWGFHPEVLPRYARHHVTGEPLTQAVIDALIASRAYGQGFTTTEYLAATLLDLEWHRLTPAAAAAIGPDDVITFERDALARNGVALERIPPRYRSTYFAHIFAGGYSAGYYSYLWSEVLDADMVEWFAENGGLRRENGRRFADHLLSRGGSVDPLAAFVAVRGRAPRVEPLLARRHLQTS